VAEPDFAKLRAERDAAIERIAREMHIKLGGDPEAAPTFHSRDYGGCYCACPTGPCEHEFSGSREILDYKDEPCGFEQFCSKCGEGAMSHDMRFAP
jgi:hypothetical protein